MGLFTGHYAAITNTRTKTQRPLGTAEPSRGKLVVDMLQDPGNATPSEYSAYNLFHGEAAGDRPTALFSSSWPDDVEKDGVGGWRFKTVALPSESVIAHSNE